MATAAQQLETLMTNPAAAALVLRMAAKMEAEAGNLDRAADLELAAAWKESPEFREWLSDTTFAINQAA
jgi:hypothetical protein